MTAQLTEERLRSWLDSRQVDRERLCLALLALDDRFENPRPRRPKGGPDGSRDIEVVFNGCEAWGAVGFKNSANDAPADKSWVREKFRTDLTAALQENPQLKSFVFFTNIDLRPSELRDLQDFASSSGILECEIFYRERIRILLDSPSGLGFRFQYLSIHLSDAEQVAFFERYGLQLEQLLLKKFDQVGKKLERIEFLHDCNKPLTGIEIIVELRRHFTPNELGHFRVLIEILDLTVGEPHPTLWIACRDSYGTHHKDGRETPIFGSKSLVWSRNPDEQIQSTVFSQALPSVDYFKAGGHVLRRGPFPTIGSMDSRFVSVFVTRPLYEAISGIGLHAGDYLLTASHVDNLEFAEQGPLAVWPEPLTDAERAVPWVKLRLRRDQSEPPWKWPRSWSLDFSNFTPQRMQTTAFTTM